MKDNNKYITYGIYVAGALLILIMIGALLNAIFGSNYKTPIQDSIKLINKNIGTDIDYAKYRTLKSEYKFATLYEKAINEDEEYYSEYLMALKEKFGDNFKVKYKITDASSLSEEEYKNVEKSIVDTYNAVADSAEESLNDFKNKWDDNKVSSKEQKKLEKAFQKYMKECQKIKVSDAYKVDIDCEIKGSKSSKDFVIRDVTVVNVNGRWIIAEGAINPMGIFTWTMIK